jgi:hypothetical protein
MASAQGVPIVKIDPDGVFKYIIINVRSQTGSFDIVRGQDPTRLPVTCNAPRRLKHGRVCSVEAAISPVGPAPH